MESFTLTEKARTLLKVVYDRFRAGDEIADIAKDAGITPEDLRMLVYIDNAGGTVEVEEDA